MNNTTVYSCCKCTEARKKNRDKSNGHEENVKGCTSTETMHNVFGHGNLSSSGTAIGKGKILY